MARCSNIFEQYGDDLSHKTLSGNFWYHNFLGVSYSFQVDEMETTTMTSSESLSSNVIIQEIHCGEPSPLEVNNASGQILPENYQAAVPLVLSTDSNDQSSAMKSPRIPIPLSALSTIAQPNQVSFGNAVIDIQQLQAFLMTLQPQLNQISTTATNFEAPSSDDATNLSAFQSECSSNAHIQCNINEGTSENDSTVSATSGLMTINESFVSRPLESYDSLVKSGEQISLSPRKLCLISYSDSLIEVYFYIKSKICLAMFCQDESCRFPSIININR